MPAGRGHARRPAGTRMRLSRIQPWLFCAPLLAGVALVFLWPLVSLFRYSFQRVGSAYIESEFVGFDNFRYVYKDPLFWKAIANNGTLLLSVPILIAVSAIVATLLFDQVKGWRAYRTFVFLPYIISIPVVGIVFGYLFQKNGLVNSALGELGIAGPDWLGSSSWAIWTIMAVIVWKELGFGVIVFLARLISVPEDIFEAARIDGAGWWARLRHIIVPQLAPAILFYAIVETITMLSWVFAYIYVMTAGGPGNSTVVSEYYIYQQTFQNTVIGIGAAAAVTLLAFVSVLILARLWLTRKVEALGVEG
jgi:raffinose/stachyose/melibiose transport system permease protein